MFTDTSSLLYAMTTKSSAYSSFQGKSTRNCLEIAYMTSANTKRFRPEHYCISTATSNRRYYHRLSQPQLLHPHTYIHMTTYMGIIITANTNHSSTLHDFPWYLYLILREGILRLRSPVDPMHIHRYPVKCIFYIHKTK